MDIFSHGLWAGAASKAINKKLNKKENKKPLKTWLAAWWGIFPDLFAFAIPVALLLLGLIFGLIKLSDLPFPHPVAGAEPPPTNTNWLFRLTSTLYAISHSAIIFIIIFFGIWLLFRRPIWELGGWLLHIIMDIPTHSYQFYPTPVFWPISSWKFNGLSWGTPWFLALDYAAIIVVYILLRRKSKIPAPPA